MLATEAHVAKAALGVHGARFAAILAMLSREVRAHAVNHAEWFPDGSPEVPLTR
jgi:hypothetical protein